LQGTVGVVSDRPDAVASEAVPTDAVRLDARNLRGIAHPVRVRLLGMLRMDGPSTATKLAARLGLSSAATSYHLRQLAEHGFVVDDPDAARGHGRERWWRAAHATTVLDALPDEPEAAAAAHEYLRAVARRYAAKLEEWLDESPTAPPEWQPAATLSDQMLLLTPDEAVDLQHRIEELVESRRRNVPGVAGPEGARRVVVQWQVLPQLGEER
jgi:predicted ArsR family transcriptional regulator